MKAITLKIIFVLSALFILMGLASILKGDIENTKEGMFMALYQLLFLWIMFMCKRNGFKRIIPEKH